MNDKHGNRTGDLDCLRSKNNCGSLTPDNSNVEWQGGWAIFLDRDENCSITNTLDDSTDDDTILQIHGPLPQGYTLIGGDKEDVQFDNKGFPLGTQNTWTLCDPSKDPKLAKAVILSPTGRIRFAREDAQGNPLTCPG